MRSNSRENVTVVTTISADGTTWKPTIIFKGQRMQADWMSEENGPPDARYTATDSSFMQGTVFLNYLKDFHKQLGERGLLDDASKHSEHPLSQVGKNVKTLEHYCL